MKILRETPGENGTGKSTLLEAIAWACGFVATHSPMLLTFPGATILCLDYGQIRSVTYQDTDHYRVTKDFLNAPERFYRHLLHDDTQK